MASQGLILWAWRKTSFAYCRAEESDCSSAVKLAAASGSRGKKPSTSPTRFLLLSPTPNLFRLHPTGFGPISSYVHSFTILYLFASCRWIAEGSGSHDLRDCRRVRSLASVASNSRHLRKLCRRSENLSHQRIQYFAQFSNSIWCPLSDSWELALFIFCN